MATGDKKDEAVELPAEVLAELQGLIGDMNETSPAFKEAARVELESAPERSRASKSTRPAATQPVTSQTTTSQTTTSQSATSRAVTPKTMAAETVAAKISAATAVAEETNKAQADAAAAELVVPDEHEDAAAASGFADDVKPPVVELADDDDLADEHVERSAPEVELDDRGEPIEGDPGVVELTIADDDDLLADVSSDARLDPAPAKRILSKYWLRYNWPFVVAAVFIAFGLLLIVLVLGSS